MTMIALALLGMVTGRVGPEGSAAEDRVADRVALRDGTELLGQVIPSRGPRVEVIVRRAWAEAHVPDQVRRWIERDRPTRQRAVAERIARLRRWSAERRAPVAGDDPIAAWIDAELARLSVPDAADRSPLLVAAFPRGEIAQLDTQPEPRRRMLRQGWRAGFDDVESMPEARLLAGLQARGFAPAVDDPAPIDDLLPIPLDQEPRWLARRAATEALNDPDLRLIRFGDLVLPDPGPGGAADGAGMAGAVGQLLGGLLGEGPAADPMRPHLDRIEASGRVGAVVTRLETAPGLDRVAVEAVLLIRTGPGRWEAGAARRSKVRPGDLPADAGRPLAQDPQVRAAFELMQGLGLGRVDAEARGLALGVGAATQHALEQARSALEADLRAVALRLDRVPAPRR